MDTKVLLISDTVFDANGVSRFIQDMAAQSRAKDGRFSVLSASPLGGEASENNITNLCPFWYMRMPFYKEQFLTVVPPWLRMASHIRSLRPDIIHISTPGPLGVCAMLIARRYAIPVAGTYHTDFPSYIRKQLKTKTAERLTRRFMRLFFHRMCKVFSRSQEYMGVLQRELQIDRSRLLFLPPGTDTRKFSPLHRNEAVWSRFDIRCDSVKLLYVGRLSVEKNFLFVVQLFERLQEVCSVPLSLIVVGEGALAETVSRRRNSHIHLLGLQKGEALSQLYASSDLMLFASVTETLGQVVMEAQASGVPCIVSDKGGVTDIVSHGETGYCLPVGGADRWVEKSRRLIENDSVRAEMGKAAWRQMRGRSIEQTYERFMQAHEEMVKSN